MYAYVCMYVCMYVYVYIYIYIPLSRGWRNTLVGWLEPNTLCMYVYIYICVCVCTYVYVCVCIYIYIYITYIHTEFTQYYKCVQKKTAAINNVIIKQPRPTVVRAAFFNLITELGGRQTGSYQTGSYQKGRFIPPKPTLSYLLFFDTTPFICL